MRGNLYNVLLTPILKKQLEELNSFEYKGKKLKFSNKNIEQAMKDLDEGLGNGLVKTNEKIYDSLMLGRSYEETLFDGTKRSFTIKFIDWENPENNVFHVVEEFSVERENAKDHARPDIVIICQWNPFCSNRVQESIYRNGTGNIADDKKPGQGLHTAVVQVCPGRNGDKQERDKIRHNINTCKILVNLERKGREMAPEYLK